MTVGRFSGSAIASSSRSTTRFGTSPRPNSRKSSASFRRLPLLQPKTMSSGEPVFVISIASCAMVCDTDTQSCAVITKKSPSCRTPMIGAFSNSLVSP
ncbi:MAG: hypothetical protein ACKOHG_14410 [Planctomycetia bacterium]